MVTLFYRVYWQTNNSLLPATMSALMNIFKNSLAQIKLIGSTKRFLEAPKIVSVFI